MEDTYGKILWEGYGLKYYGGTRTRTGLICKTDVGLRELKKARSRREDLLFAHEVKTCLYRNGFSALSLFYNGKFVTTDLSICTESKFTKLLK